MGAPWSAKVTGPLAAGGASRVSRPAAPGRSGGGPSLAARAAGGASFRGGRGGPRAGPAEPVLVVDPPSVAQPAAGVQDDHLGGARYTKGAGTGGVLV